MNTIPEYQSEEQDLLNISTAEIEHSPVSESRRRNAVLNTLFPEGFGETEYTPEIVNRRRNAVFNSLVRV